MLSDTLVQPIIEQCKCVFGAVAEQRFGDRDIMRKGNRLSAYTYRMLWHIVTKAVGEHRKLTAFSVQSQNPIVKSTYGCWCLNMQSRQRLDRLRFGKH